MTHSQKLRITLYRAQNYKKLLSFQNFFILFAGIVPSIGKNPAYKAEHKFFRVWFKVNNRFNVSPTSCIHFVRNGFSIAYNGAIIEGIRFWQMLC